MAMVGGVSPATMLQDKATIRPPSAVLFRISEGEFLNSPEDSYVLCGLLDDDEEGQPILLWQIIKDVYPLKRCCEVIVL